MESSPNPNEKRSSLEKAPVGVENDTSSNQEERKISLGKERNTSVGGENETENRRRSSAKDGNKTDKSRATSGSGENPGDGEGYERKISTENENQQEEGDGEGEETNMYSFGEEEDETGEGEGESEKTVKDDQTKKGDALSFLNNMTFDWQKEGETTGNDAEIQKLFGISTAIQDIENLLKDNYEEEEEEGGEEEEEDAFSKEPESEPGPGIPQYPRKKVKQWLVFCDKDKGKNQEKSTVPKYTVLLSPQPSIEDVGTPKENYIPIKCNVSDPNHLETWGSIKALRGSTAQTTVFSGVPSRYTLQSAYCSKYNTRCHPSISSFMSGSNSMRFDPRDEPIWQRGRHFTHPSDPNKRHFITIINTLNYDIKVTEASQSTPLQAVLDGYRSYNANIDNYRWTDVYEKPLDFNLTLHQNGLVDNSYITDEIGLDYYPVILLFFNDGFENDPPMQLDIRKAFVRDEVLLCRNYQLHGVPDPGEGQAGEQQEPEEKVTLISPLLRSRKSTMSSNKGSKGGDTQRSSAVKYSDGSTDSNREARKRLLSAQRKTSTRQTSFEDGDNDADMLKIKKALSRTSKSSGDSKKSNASRKTSFAIKAQGSSERRKTLDADVEQAKDDVSSNKKMSTSADKENVDADLDLDVEIALDIDADAEMEQLENTEKRLSTGSNEEGRKKNSTDSDSIPPEREPEDQEPSPTENLESQDTEAKSSRKSSRKKTSNVSDES